MADAFGWPDIDELKRVVNLEADVHDDTLQATLNAAIDKVKGDVGNWDDDVDSPTPQQNRAAFRLALLTLEKPGMGTEVVKDPVYRGLMVGQRRRFGVA